MFIIAMYVLYAFLIIVIAGTVSILIRRIIMKRSEANYRNDYKKVAALFEQYIRAEINEVELAQKVQDTLGPLEQHLILQVILDYKHVWDGEVSYALINELGVTNLIKKYIKSNEQWKVIMALNALITLKLKGFTFDAEQLMIKSKDELVKHTAIEYLIGMEQFNQLERMVTILAKIDDWYLASFIDLFTRHQSVVVSPLLELFHIKDNLDDKICILKILKAFHSIKTKQLFHKLLDSDEQTIKELAAEYFIEIEPNVLIEKEFHLDRYPYVRALYFKALQKIDLNQSHIDLLLIHGNDDYQVIRRHVVDTLVNICRKRPQIKAYLEKKLKQESDYDNTIINVFELIEALDQYIWDLERPEYQETAKLILKKAITLGEIGHILVFLTQSKNDSLNDNLTTLLLENVEQSVLLKSQDLVQRVRQPFRKRIEDKLSNFKETKETEPKQKNIRQRLLLAGILLLISILPISVIAFRHYDILFDNNYQLFLVKLIQDFNYGILFYVGTINSVYLLLGVISLIGLIQYNNRKRAWLAGDYFKRRVVPPITLLAPCYNESETIIESVSSLLHIRYPRFEVVVVNDGSQDDTLAKLIDYYQLEQMIPNYTELLKTEKVRKVYRSKRYKNLVVVDKENGGKADALNAGINIANYELFCAIDADTLIEGESLINAAAPFSFDHSETIATGGNIRVINGCTVEDGEITGKSLPRRTIERFQVLEYIRAFMGGRIGWSYLNNLLIISGAFGVFKKKQAFQIGGYSTMKSREFHTVGEDMELVVQYHKHSMANDKKYKITFCHDANGWTEVPETLKGFRKQRNRWHRGMLEVMVNNMGMMFKPKYKKTTSSYGHHFLFEMAGPWLEVLGYLLVILAAVLQVLDPAIAVMLFALSVLYGIMISLFGLYLEEKETIRYTSKEIILLIGIAVIENFGFRQLSAFWRVGAYISLLFNKQGWGFIQRKGFR